MVILTGVHLYWYTQHQFLSTSRAGHVWHIQISAKEDDNQNFFSSVGSDVVGTPSELAVPEHLDPTRSMVVPYMRSILCQISNNREICVTQQLLCSQWLGKINGMFTLDQQSTLLWTPGMLFLNILMSQGGQWETFLSWTPLDKLIFSTASVLVKGFKNLTAHRFRGRNRHHP